MIRIHETVVKDAACKFFCQRSPPAAMRGKRRKLGGVYQPKTFCFAPRMFVRAGSVAYNGCTSFTGQRPMPTTTESDRQVDSLEQFVANGKHRGATYGMQWGDPDTAPLLARVKNEFLLPSLARGITAIEIGCGGGRWSRYFLGRVQKLFLVDATPSAEIAVRARGCCDGFEFIVAKAGKLSSIAAQSVDYAFSFDTFVHFHRELFDDYVRELSRVLRPGGLLHLHHAARWPEASINEQIFQYRDDKDVDALFGSASLRRTNFAVEFRAGYGSVLREAVRVLR